jgi:RNA polymerase sigma factor (TIGR02999 family)
MLRAAAIPCRKAVTTLSASSKSDITLLLEAVARESADAEERLLERVMAELRALAAAKVAGEPKGLDLQATALVNEAWLKLVDTEGKLPFESRRHFFGAAALAMQRILVDEARRRKRDRHGGGWQRISLPDLADDRAREFAAVELLALEEALPRLTAENPLAAEIVRLKFFAGLSRAEIARMLELSVHEVRLKWDYARAWLQVAMEAG